MSERDNLGLKLVSATNIPKRERSSVTLRGVGASLKALAFFVGWLKTILLKSAARNIATEHALNRHFGNLTCRPTSYAAQNLPPNSLDAPRR